MKRGLSGGVVEGQGGHNDLIPRKGIETMTSVTAGVKSGGHNDLIPRKGIETLEAIYATVGVNESQRPNSPKGD